MNKINFQNGTLVSKAKVTIGGTVYEVEPAEYEGTTPLNAENLNQMQTNMENAIPPVVDNLTSTSTTSTLSANQGKVLKELIEGTVLYENEQGTNSNFVLSDNLSNYSRLKVFGFFRSSNFSRKFTQELEIGSGPNVNNLVISVIENSSLNATLVGTARVTFNGNQATITINYTRVIDGSDTATDEIHVTKVVGYIY
nr:MAG TPA: hypothetical protein [Caudoviricetes sp.]